MDKFLDKKKVCAIICEYNPMHTGHTYLIKNAKKITGANYVLGLMSGNFSQRSEPCVLDKYSRAKIATLNGMDLIINLPTVFCTNNAEIFALSSIKILNKLNVDYLAFGVETLNEKAFYSLAKFCLKNPKSFKISLKKNLKLGLNYNNAFTKSLEENINLFEKKLQEDVLNILKKPNNILALEYIKSILKTKSKIKPVFIKRADNYNDKKIVENFVSASFIRENLLNKNLDKFKNFLVKNIDELLVNSNVNINKFHDLILFKIKTTKTSQIKKIYAVDEGLENRIKSLACNTNSFDEFYDKLKTKRYKENKLNSALLNILLDIDKKTVNKIYTIKNNIYVKTLALNCKNSDILKNINTKCLILRKQDERKINKCSYNKKLFEIENKANSVYNLISNTHLLEEDIYNKMVTVK